MSYLNINAVKKRNSIYALIVEVQNNSNVVRQPFSPFLPLFNFENDLNRKMYKKIR